MNSKPLITHDRLLERLRFASNHRIARALLHNTELKTFVDAKLDEMVLQLNAEVLGEKLAHVEIPDGLWETLKAEHPRWYRFLIWPTRPKPVRAREAVDRYVLFPDFEWVPPPGSGPTMVVHEMRRVGYE